MDTSKAFDTIKRTVLIQELSTVISPVELHLIKQLIGNVRLEGKFKNVKSVPFGTNVGVSQGDNLSPNLLTFYLAKTSYDNNNKKEERYGNKIIPTHNHQHKEELQFLEDHNHQHMQPVGTKKICR